MCSCAGRAVVTSRLNRREFIHRAEMTGPKGDAILQGASSAAIPGVAAAGPGA